MARAFPISPRAWRTIRILAGLGLIVLVSLAASPVAFAQDSLAEKVQPGSGYNFPRDVSLDGHRIDWLIEITMVFCIILFVVMCIWMVWASVKHGRDRVADYDLGESKHSIFVALALSMGIFFVVDGNLFYHSVRDLNQAFWNYDRPLSDPDHVKIEINGHQWAWDFRYPGPDGVFATQDDFTMLNDLRIPVDTPVIVQLGASDVLHSFALPNFRVKQDAVPGSVTQLWFQATQTGTFEIVCAQHCGTNHYKMKAHLSVMAKHDYEAWKAHSTKLAALAYDPDDVDARWGWPWEEL